MKPLKPGEKVKGYIPAVDVSGPNLDKQETKLIPWQDAARIGKDNRPNPRVFAPPEAIPRHIFEDGLPPIVRRTARQRYEVLVNRLLEVGRMSQAKAGYPVWPESMQRVLDNQGYARTNTDLHGQVYALAKHYIVKSENQQRAKDRKKVVLDWHGHHD